MKRGALLLALLTACVDRRGPVPTTSHEPPPTVVVSSAGAGPVVRASVSLEDDVCGSRPDAAPSPVWETHEAATRIVDAPYESRVTALNMRASGAATTTWARYLNTIHNRIHPIFADAFLDSLCTRPRSDPANDGRIFTRLELVIGADGSLERLGVVRSSGNRDFDLGAVETVQRVAPLPPPDASLLSSDGHAYVQWEFHRAEVFACSTMHARPYALALGP